MTDCHHWKASANRLATAVVLLIATGRPPWLKWDPAWEQAKLAGEDWVAAHDRLEREER